AIQAAKKRYAEQTNNHGEITVTETVTDEVLISDSTAREEPLEVPLSHIKKLFTTNNFYMVVTSEKMIYAFKKGAFTLGTEEAFTAFMTQQIEHNKRKGQ
ncbi:MAG: YcxB family protein, partial [Ruminococcus sp.]|nr:YcxB family protein [Ruminococcus sp.]